MTTIIDTPIIETPVTEQVQFADLKPRGYVQPSPSSWRDQVFYFLLPDRFSDGEEGQRPMFDWKEPGKFHTKDMNAWRESGKIFQNGVNGSSEGKKLKGIQSKLPYLKNLGITTLWVGPIWRQRRDDQTYHGYAIQNFFDVDPRFGTKQDLRDLVDEAHRLGIYVVLDVIYNHTGDNWFYDNNGTHSDTMPYRYAPEYPVYGWRSENGQPTNQINTKEDGVWPKDFQEFSDYTRAGKIRDGHWDAESWENPMHSQTEFRRGDFFDLKDLNLLKDEVLSDIIRIYQYWIAVSDCDGFRVDTVKHVPWEASRSFCGAIHEYAESIGKENFLMLGEVTGGAEMAHNYLEIFGRNIDAVLDIGEPTRRLEGMVKGLTPPEAFFAQYGGHDSLGSHRETGRYHVSPLDDHDMVGREKKQRFAANNQIKDHFTQTAHAVGVQLTTLGIPCIYYGTEQAFDGNEDRDPRPADKRDFEDRYIRESMFGSTFGAFETSGCHFFNENHPTYLRIRAIAQIRQRDDAIGMALRRGRQYMRETRFWGPDFNIPGQGELIAWSRIMLDQEVLIVLNTNGTENRGADITVEKRFHKDGSTMNFLYKSDWTNEQLKNSSPSQTANIKSMDGRATVRVDLPPAGMAILV